MPREQFTDVSDLADEHKVSYLDTVRAAFPDVSIVTQVGLEFDDNDRPTGRRSTSFMVKLGESEHRLKFAAGVGGMRAADMPTVLGRWLERWKARQAG